MSIKPKSFFYPVLSKFSTDYKSTEIFDVEISPRVEDNSEGSQISFEYEVNLTNDSIRDCIIDQRAIIAFDIYCGDTMYRSTERTSQLSGGIILPQNQVKGRIEVQPLILVSDHSSTFVLEGINGEYPTNQFELNVGDPLAIAPAVVIPVDFAKVAVRDVLKIQLQPSLEKNTYEIDLTRDQIVVHMGANVHSAFTTFSIDPIRKPVLFFSVYKDCIVAVLEAITRGIGDAEYQWYEGFIEQLEKRNIKIPSEDVSFGELNEVALRLLGSRGFEKVLQNVNN